MEKNLKKFKGLFLLLGTVILAACASGVGAGQRPAPDIQLDAPAPSAPPPVKMANPISSGTVVMKVNGEEVKEGRVDEMIAHVYESIQQQYHIGPEGLPQEMRDNMRAKILDQIKQQVVINQAVKKLNFTPSAEQIKHEMDILTTQIQLEGGDKMTMENWIAKMKTSDPKFSEEVLRDQIKTQLQVMAVMENESKTKIDPTADEIKAVYDKDPHHWGKVRASHILILTQKPAGDAASVDKDALAKAQSVLKEVQAGKVSFADLAKKYSDDKNGPDGGSAAKGGDVDFFFFETMVPEFAAKAFSQKNGEISGLVKTEYGYHIIKTVDFQPVTLENAKNRIILAERQKKVTTIIRPAMENLMKTAKVEDLGPKPAPAPMSMMPPPDQGGNMMMAPPPPAPATKK